MKDIGKALKGMKNVPKLVSIFKRGTASAKDFRNLLQFCFKSLLIREQVRGLDCGRSAEIVQKILQTFDRDAFQTVLELIEMVIDFDESEIERRVSIKANVEEGLDELRRDYAALPSMLNSIAQQLRQTVSPEHADS